MFGKQWVSAQGTVVATRPVKTTGDGMVTILEYVVDVRTPDGEVFRAQVDEPRMAMDFLPPSVGAVVRVQVEPNSRKVRFDKDDPALSQKAAKRQRAAAFDAALGSPPDDGGPSRPRR
jgi:hypothetical protein